MSGGKSLLQPKTIIPTILSGGIFPIASGLKKLATPDGPPTPGATPMIQAPPTPTDANPPLTALQKSKKLKSLQMGFASTITSRDNGFGNAMPGLKTQLGQ